VLANSPAEHAGLRAGDQVLAVDGRDIGQWDLPQISDLLDEGEPGRKVPVRVLRGGQEKKLNIKLAEVVR
jgi:S1-C subfamily serine protease